MQAEGGRVQASGRVAQVWLFNPQQGGAVLALLALVVVAGLEAQQQQSNEEDSKDGERVEEDKVEQGFVGTHHRMDRRGASRLYVDDGKPGVVGGEAVPRVARVEQPLLHVAVVSPCVAGSRPLDGEAVLV